MGDLPHFQYLEMEISVFMPRVHHLNIDRKCHIFTQYFYSDLDIWKKYYIDHPTWGIGIKTWGLFWLNVSSILNNINVTWLQLCWCFFFSLITEAVQRCIMPSLILYRIWYIMLTFICRQGVIACITHLLTNIGTALNMSKTISKLHLSILFFLFDVRDTPTFF